MASDVKRWRENILEEFFILQKHLNMSVLDIRSLPIRYRKWYIDRLNRFYEENRQKPDDATPPASSNIEALNKLEEKIRKK